MWVTQISTYIFMVCRICIAICWVNRPAFYMIACLTIAWHFSCMLGGMNSGDGGDPWNNNTHIQSAEYTFHTNLSIEVAKCIH